MVIHRPCAPTEVTCLEALCSPVSSHSLGSFLPICPWRLLGLGSKADQRSSPLAGWPWGCQPSKRCAVRIHPHPVRPRSSLQTGGNSGRPGISIARWLVQVFLDKEYILGLHAPCPAIDSLLSRLVNSHRPAVPMATSCTPRATLCTPVECWGSRGGVQAQGGAFVTYWESRFALSPDNT